MLNDKEHRRTLFEKVNKIYPSTKGKEMNQSTISEQTPHHSALEVMAVVENMAKEQASLDKFNNTIEFHKSHILGALEDLMARQEAERF